MVWHVRNRTWGSNFSLDDINSIQDINLDGIEYVHNSMGFRGPEIEDAQVVIAGCSQTYGEGVPYEATWGHRLASSMEKSYVNLGVRGASIPGVVTRVLGYLDNFSAPEYIFCVMPNTERIEFPYTNETRKEFTAKWGKQDLYANGDDDVVLSTYIHPHGSNSPRPKYLKLPYELENVFSIEYIDIINMDYIRMLERVCEAKNIVLRWGTWDSRIENKYSTENAVNISPNFVRLVHTLGRIFELDDNKATVCHLEELEKYGKNFLWGMDAYREPSVSFGHWGVHSHIHTAELFSESLLS